MAESLANNHYQSRSQFLQNPNSAIPTPSDCATSGPGKVMRRPSKNVAQAARALRLLKAANSPVHRWPSDFLESRSKAKGPQRNGQRSMKSETAGQSQ